MDIKVIDKQSKLYPNKLKNILNAPEKLYAIGDIEILNNRSIAIVGSRKCSNYGIKYAKKFAKEIASTGITVVSGFAIGIDYIAHEISQCEKGKTIAVLGCGLNHIYPAENKELFYSILKNGGCIISEYEPNTQVDMKNFPKRNRIISGISDGVLVIEAGSRSGSTITGRFGLEQNKNVFCLPRGIEDTKGKGTNLLIQKGAKLVTSAKDVLEEFENWNIVSKKENIDAKDELYEEDMKINYVPKEYVNVYQLISYTPQNIHYFANKSGMRIAEVTQKLIMLELQGYIKSMPRELLCKDISRMYKKKVFGNLGEDIACKFVLDKGYEIINRNFYCRQGEIDIVAKDKNELVFIEVKTRKNANYGRPIDAITFFKKKHFIESIEYYLYKNNVQNIPVRVDVIEVYEKEKSKFLVHHVKNAIEK